MDRPESVIREARVVDGFLLLDDEVILCRGRCGHSGEGRLIVTSGRNGRIAAEYPPGSKEMQLRVTVHWDNHPRRARVRASSPGRGDLAFELEFRVVTYREVTPLADVVAALNQVGVPVTFE